MADLYEFTTGTDARGAVGALIEGEEATSRRTREDEVEQRRASSRITQDARVFPSPALQSIPMEIARETKKGREKNTRHRLRKWFRAIGLPCTWQ